MDGHMPVVIILSFLAITITQYFALSFWLLSIRDAIQQFLYKSSCPSEVLYQMSEPFRKKAAEYTEQTVTVSLCLLVMFMLVSCQEAEMKV